MLRHVASFVLLVSSSVSAFDTGHHFDATRNSMLLRGFNPASDAINIAQLQNFATDFNALGKLVDYPNFDTVYDEANLLHFNSLYNSTMIRKNWIQLYNNSYQTLKALVNRNIKIGTVDNVDASSTLNDLTFQLLSMLGIMLHNNQDFYAHSNWITAENPSQDNCYYASSMYAPEDPANDALNLHTYYYPENTHEQERVQNQWNYKDLTIHGGYFNGINKDSYNKQNWDHSYVNAIVQSIDTVDTFHLWLTEFDPSGTLWQKMQNYNLTNPTDIHWLDYGTNKLFSVSAYVKLAWWEEDETNGHWKGKGSGDTITTIEIYPGYARGDFQSQSIFQQFVWNTDFLPNMVYQLAKIQQFDTVPMWDDATIKTMLPPRVRNNPADFQAIVVKTEAVSRVGANKNPEWAGLYAIIGIEGQFYRETPLYDVNLFPWWTSIRLVPASTKLVSISYDLAIWTSDQDDKEKLASITAYKAVASFFTGIFHKIKVALFGAEPRQRADESELLTNFNVNKLAVNSKTHSLTQKFKSQQQGLNQFSESLSGSESNEIEAAVVVNRTGAFFTFATDSHTITEGLPADYLNKVVDSWPEHQLVFIGNRSDGSAAMVNITITTRTLCNATYQVGTLGDVAVANTTYQALYPGTFPNPTPYLSGANDKYNYGFITLATPIATAVLLSVRSIFSL